MAKLLFVLKKREMTNEEGRVLWDKPAEPNSPYFKYCVSSGLRNSAKFVVDMLNDQGIEAKLVEVIDNNCIDREVTAYKPTHVIIEAFWVVPEKFGVLNKLHPTVQWIVRNHSELPFLANEGIAMEWSLSYLKYDNVYLAPNSHKTFLDTVVMAVSAFGIQAADKVLYLPNFYQIKKQIREPLEKSDILNVGCFGAIRPFKNHMVQAVAAVHYATFVGKKLRFHVNVARIEDSGNNTLKSLRGFFKHLDPAKFELVEHGWLDHDDFLELIATMDICLQASFTESFNIVTADAVSQGVPVVVSEEIEWLPKQFVARHTNARDILAKMKSVLKCFSFWCKANSALKGLLKYNKNSIIIWTSTFK